MTRIVLAALLSCSAVCGSHYYPKGFPHPNPRLCYCADEIEKVAPTPLVLGLHWSPYVDQEERKAVIIERPRFDLEPTDE